MKIKWTRDSDIPYSSLTGVDGEGNTYHISGDKRICTCILKGDKKYLGFGQTPSEAYAAAKESEKRGETRG